MSDSSLPLVSICMISYNHKKFIRQAIEGVLMQDTNFEYELVISDDCSPDNTGLEIQKCIDEHPNGKRIKYFQHKVNLGGLPNILFAFNECSGKYIAICEGDDYWTDVHKLQKQIDFLEANEDYSMCCHNAKVVYEDKSQNTRDFSNIYNEVDFDMATIINSWVIPTASMVIRAEFIKPLPEWVKNIYSIDFTLALLLMAKGKIKFLAESLSVYRIDLGGSSMSAVVGGKIEFVANQHIQLLQHFNEETGRSYDGIVTKKIGKLQNEIKFLKLRRKSPLLALFLMPRLFCEKILNKISK